MRNLLALGIMVLACAGPAPARQAQSLYTPLDEKQCQTLKADPSGSGSSTQRCPGVGGYALLVLEGDLRQTISVVAPGGREYPLELWSKISGGFSTVGPRAEWRVTKRGEKVEPYALIVRFNASENPEDPSKITSYLAVAKITPGAVCVTDKIEPGPRANEQARQAADASRQKPCME